jgi:hypothetical protein
VLRTLPEDCPKCRKPLRYAHGLSEFMCLECMWAPGEPGCDAGYAPTYLLTVSEYCTMVGLLYKQRRANQISCAEYEQLLLGMEIK